ncbi:chromate transporter [Paenibacillus ihumii]|uniref:chromate transporter n=1 Tax=Paenibacillus ihumii TaxID=687436 RepID=UPI0006D7C9FF|nr:chromate transporter [Paenibacillus ihumii]
MRTGLIGKLSILWDLFWTFFKIGPSTFGGGYAMISTIEHAVVEKQQWMDEREISDMISIAGAAPGGVGINSSVFIGYRLGKIPGAVAAVLGITLPTFLILIGLSAGYTLLQNEPKMISAFKGINGAVIGLIAVAAYRMGKASLFDLPTKLLAAASLLLLLFTGLNPIYLILIGLIAGNVIIGVKKALGLPLVPKRASSASEGSSAEIIEYYI